jgi:4-amino-4-deoxy-L-arabinose transferase-like glycosyltransferase
LTLRESERSVGIMQFQPAWARPRQVALLIAAYLLVHLGMRLWMGPTLGVDDAEQALFAQHWLWNYRFRAPPLFTWALVATSTVVPVGFVTISLLRYLLLAMLLGFTYLTARRLIRDPTLAALAAFSFTAIYVVGYYSHHDLTHTTVLSAFLAASWYAFVRLCETPTLRWYLALGLCFGLGMLGKWNFLMFAAALPLACLAHPAYRGLVLTWKIVPAAAVAAAITLPAALWAYHGGPSAGDDLGKLLGRPSDSFLLGVLKGTADLALALLTYPQPFLVPFLIAFGALLWRGLRAPQPSRQVVQPVPDSRLVGTVIAIAIVLHWLLVPFARATDFSERLLQPALQILPIYLFMLVEQAGEVPAQTLRAYAATLAGVAAIALVARIGIHVAGGDYCRGPCRALAPFSEAAAGLRAAGFQGRGTIVVRGFHAGGNLRVQFPQARVVETGYPARTWPAPAGRGQCIGVWPSEYGDGRDIVESYLARELGADAKAPRREGEVTALMQGARKRSYRLHYLLYDGPQGECR